MYGISNYEAIYPDIIRVAFVRETQIPELDDIHQIDTFGPLHFIFESTPR